MNGSLMCMDTWTFQTHIDDEPRTHGALAVRPDTSNFDPSDMRMLAGLASNCRNATAWGKVVIVRDNDAAVFQTTLAGQAEPAWCGNATAAAAVLKGAGSSAIRILGPGPLYYEVETNVTGNRVDQTWLIPNTDIEIGRWMGRSIVRSRFLNNYTFVEGPLPAEIAPEKLMAELSGIALTAKLAVFRKSSAATHVQFFNSNGAHGAAPLTGLATLAVLLCRCDWLQGQFPNNSIAYDTSKGRVIEPLPTARDAGGGKVSLSMPSVSVVINPQYEGALDV